jgi:hypothetical protein
MRLTERDEVLVNAFHNARPFTKDYVLALLIADAKDNVQNGPKLSLVTDNAPAAGLAQLRQGLG